MDVFKKLSYSRDINVTCTLCGSKVESHFYSTNQTQPYRIKADLNQTLGLFSVSYDAQCLLWVCCGHPRADPKQYAPQADPEWTLKADPDFRILY